MKVEANHLIQVNLVGTGGNNQLELLKKTAVEKILNDAVEELLKLLGEV